eukprot:4750687-Prymnesium_polylepis.1
MHGSATPTINSMNAAGVATAGAGASSACILQDRIAGRSGREAATAASGERTLATALGGATLKASTDDARSGSICFVKGSSSADRATFEEGR